MGQRREPITFLYPPLENLLNFRMKIHALSQSLHKGSTRHRVWKFERVNDQTDEDPRTEETIKSQVAEIGFLRQLIADARKAKAESHLKLLQLTQDVTALKSQAERLELLLAEVSL
ncbi:hypothetical protein B0J17DRAFT_679669 [Rhizoctonia solani]|nr:hypothetical protein B0J17DRAFT_679669 [Rhizoctonia solani]